MYWSVILTMDWFLVIRITTGRDNKFLLPVINCTLLPAGTLNACKFRASFKSRTHNKHTFRWYSATLLGDLQVIKSQSKFFSRISTKSVRQKGRWWVKRAPLFIVCVVVVCEFGCIPLFRLPPKKMMMMMTYLLFPLFPPTTKSEYRKRGRKIPTQICRPREREKKAQPGMDKNSLLKPILCVTRKEKAFGKIP